MTDQVQPEGGATPSIDKGANPSFAAAKAEAQVAEAKPAKDAVAESPPAATDPSDKKKPEPDGRDLRIKELTRRLRQQERAHERLLKEYENRERTPAPQSPQQPTARKTLKDFNYNDAAFAEYLSQESRTEATEAARKEAERIRGEELASIRAERFQERVAKFTETHPDFDEVVYDGPKWPCPKEMAEAIEDADEGPAIAYHLAQNPSVAAQIARLSAVQIGREIQKLEDRLVSERKKAAEPQISKAPPPPPKIEGGDPGNVESSPLKMSEDQLKNWSDAKFRKWREGSMARRR